MKEKLMFDWLRGIEDDNESIRIKNPHLPETESERMAHVLRELAKYSTMLRKNTYKSVSRRLEEQILSDDAKELLK